MDKRISIGIDHCSIFNRDLSTSTDIFFALGFRGDGNCCELSESVKSAFVPSCRFMLDNAYLECVQFPEEMGEFYYFLRSQAAIHLMTNLTPDAEEFRAVLAEHGYPDAAVDTTIREGASHGSVTGTAKFLLVPVHTHEVPDTHLAWEQHCTRDLIYQPTRWQHGCGAKTIEELTVCMDDEDKAEAMMARLLELDHLAQSEKCPGGLRSLRVMDTASFEGEFGVKPNPQRSMYSALTFGVEDLDAVATLLSDSDLDWKREDGRILVNAMEALNLVLVFIPVN